MRPFLSHSKHELSVNKNGITIVFVYSNGNWEMKPLIAEEATEMAAKYLQMRNKFFWYKN